MKKKPFKISKKTLTTMDASMKNFKIGKASKPIDISYILNQKQKQALGLAFAQLDMWDLITHKIWIASKFIPQFEQKIKKGKSTAYIGRLWTADCYVCHFDDPGRAVLMSSSFGDPDPIEPPDDYLVFDLNKKEGKSYVGYTYAQPDIEQVNEKLMSRIEGLENIVNAPIYKFIWRRIKKWIREKRANPPKPRQPQPKYKLGQGDEE